MQLTSLADIKLTGISYNLLSNKEIKAVIKEYARQRYLEGWVMHEIIILTKQEFCLKKKEDDPDPPSNPQAVTVWVEQIISDITSTSRPLKENYDSNLAVAQERLDYLYRIAMANSDIKSANAILKHLHAVQGINSIGGPVVNVGIVNNQQNNGTPDGPNFSNMSNEDLRKHIENNPSKNLDVEVTTLLQNEVGKAAENGQEAVINHQSAETVVQVHNSQFN